MRLPVLIFASSTILAFCAISASAQDTTAGAIAGTVTDATLVQAAHDLATNARPR